MAVVLYEALTGENPFAGITLTETLSRIHNIPDIRVPLADCPDAVIAFFLSALSKDLRKRPATAAEIRLRLESVKNTI